MKTKSAKNVNLEAGLYYLLGNLFNKGLNFLTIPLFTRLLSTSDYGIVNTYLSWVPIIAIIIGLSLSNTIRNAYIDFSNKLDDYIKSILVLALLNTSIITIITYPFYKFLKIDNILIILCLIQSYATFIYNLFDVKYMMEINYKKRTKLLIIPNIIIVILSVIFILLSHEKKYLSRIIANVIVFACIGFIYFFRYVFNNNLKIDINYWKYGLKLSLPLVLHGLSLNILATSDRTMLTYYHSSKEAGIYSVIYNLSMMVSVVTLSLESVWVPWFNNKLKEMKKDIINKYAKIYIQLILTVMIITLNISPELIKIMVPKEYWSGIIIMPPLIFSSFIIFLYSLNVNTEYYYHSTKVMAVSTIVAAILNIILNTLFIPNYGINAAAYTTLIAYFVSFLMHYKASHKLDSKLFPNYFFVIPILIFTLVVFCFYIFINNIVVRWLITIIIIIYIALRKNFILYLKKLLQEK